MTRTPPEPHDLIGPDWRDLIARATVGVRLDAGSVAGILSAAEAMERVRVGTGRAWLEEWAARRRPV